ncbi:hypothetical protein CPLU01_02815 [Colletotrichum plurivorum]|uniref:Uncharacterized protein n=1 Tax=Colletotrichum plurivorum TaxID=2175906 RepID=A0A8H6KUK5_9PEZI|nr:hypothetical protein CPLU01_02815 [Colletotrichum plurivorum]
MSAAGWTVLQSNPSLAADLSLIHPSLAEMAGLPETTAHPDLANDGPNRSYRRARPSKLEPEPEPGGLESSACTPNYPGLPCSRWIDAAMHLKSGPSECFPRCLVWSSDMCHDTLG